MARGEEGGERGLFTPYRVRGVTLRNRIVVSPMCQYSSEDGFASDWHLVHLGSRAVGGSSLVFAEATAVLAEGRISPFDLGLWKDEQVAPLKRVTEFVAAQGAVPGIQLGHAGRKASTAPPWVGGKAVGPEAGGWRPIYAPSAIPYRAGGVIPEALDAGGIERVIEGFGAAARRALAAGFQVLEVHSAHGYLLHEFLSPLSNRREDGWGGSFEGRTRLTLEVVREVRRHWPAHLPLFVRLSATDWVEGGWSPEDTVRLSRLLASAEVDLVDCSSGGLIPDAVIPSGPGYQVPFAAEVRRAAGIATGAVGLITDPRHADQIVRSQQADLVIMARELLRHPYWPLWAARTLDQAGPWPDQYLRARLNPTGASPA